jgi:4a-hydroxytetrahydrobiopterin dehydratase
VPALLSEDEIARRLPGVPDWRREGSEIVRTFAFENFVAAVAFVNRVTPLAEAANHHPDVDIRWNKVTLRLATHSRGGVTHLDFDLAARIDEGEAGGRGR